MPESTIADAVRDSGAVLTSLTDEKAVRAVVLDAGLPGLMASGSALIEMSTIDVATSAGVAEACADADIEYLRAPVSGNPGAVRGGRAALLVSGTTERGRCTLPPPGGDRTGRASPGEGDESRIAKLCVNLMLAGITELLAEVVVLGERSGLARHTIANALSKSVVGSTFLAYKTERPGARLQRDVHDP